MSSRADRSPEIVFAIGADFSIFRGPVGSHASYGAADKAASQYGFIIISPHVGSGGGFGEGEGRPERDGG